MKKITLILTMIIGLAVASSARATLFDYDYVGNPFNEVRAPYTTADRVTVWMSVDLPSNLNFVGNIDGLISDIIVKDGVQEYSTTLVNFIIIKANIQTDSTGVITNWELEFDHDPMINPPELIFTQTCNFHSPSSNGCASSTPVDAGDVGPGGANRGGLVAFNPGIWTQNSAADPIPEPSTLLLLGSGLAGLVFFRWRRKTG